MQVKMIKSIIFSCIFFLILVPAHKIYSKTPDEDRVKDIDLNLESAGVMLDKIEIALKDYRNFTDIILNYEVLNKLEEKKTTTIIIKSSDLKNLSTLEWSTQNIGFVNWLIVVRGTLLKSAYLNKKYEYELAKYQKNFSKKELTKLKNAMNEAFKKYKKFLDNINYID